MTPRRLFADNSQRKSATDNSIYRVETKRIRKLRREVNMLITKNSKRKNVHEEYKRIPINPMLAPYICDIKEFRWYHMETLYKHFRRLMSNHALYDLRTTFYTRCRECGVADAARDEMVGHSSGVLADAYTDLSDAYLIQEASKIKYELPLDQ